MRKAKHAFIIFILAVFMLWPVIELAFARGGGGFGGGRGGGGWSGGGRGGFSGGGGGFSRGNGGFDRGGAGSWGDRGADGNRSWGQGQQGDRAQGIHNNSNNDNTRNSNNNDTTNNYTYNGGGGYYGAPGWGWGWGAADGVLTGMALSAAMNSNNSNSQPSTVIVNNEQPSQQQQPSESYNASAPVAPAGQPAYGTQVTKLPRGTQSRNVNGMMAYQDGSVWYRPFIGSNGAVFYEVVPPPPSGS